MARHPPVAVKVSGELACFTRPEMKAERVSYPVITPSAARGVLEAIFWKPEFRWEIREIRVLQPIRFTSFLRNEVKSKVSERSVASWIKAGRHDRYFADEDRTQRSMLALRDVAYVLLADAVPHSSEQDAEVKFRDQFRRRVARGQCYHMPYLGCREFAADFEEPSDADQPIPHSETIGPMLFDLRYPNGGGGPAEPVFFDASLDHGVLRLPVHLYGRTRGGER